MPTLAVGAVVSVYCPLSGTMTVTPGTSGRVSINARGRDGSQSLAPRELYSAETFTVSAGDVVGLEAINAAATYTDPAESGPALQALVSDAGEPFDTLTAPLQQVTITGAISTTAALTATATGTYRKARVAWNNNGASGTAKLRIAANTDNDVHGLVAGQSAKRRDYEMTMGDSVLLVCPEPTTRLTFSADGSITAGTHSIQVTFGS